MNIRLNNTPVCLTRNQAITVTQAKGSQIRCKGGSVWITQDQDPRDVVLSRSESFVLDRNGEAIVWALATSTVEMIPPRRTHGLASAFTRWLGQAQWGRGRAAALPA